MAVWSVYPLADATEWYAAAHPELRAWLELPGGGHLRLDVLHTTAPYGSGEPGVWAKEMAAIRSELAHEPRPLIAVGDLNATWYDWHFQALLGLGFRDAAAVSYTHLDVYKRQGRQSTLILDDIEVVRDPLEGIKGLPDPCLLYTSRCV